MLRSLVEQPTFLLILKSRKLKKPLDRFRPINSCTVLRGDLNIVHDKSKRDKKPYKPQSYDSPWIIKLSQYGNRSCCKSRQKCEGQEPPIVKHRNVHVRLLIVE